MNATALATVSAPSGDTLPALIDRASTALASARSSAEVLEARDMARVAYDAAKTAGRMARAKSAHDEVIAAVYRAQADALLIEARAKMRLADEYDAAQERGEVANGRDGPGAGVVDDNAKATAADLGIRRDEIHEARKLRDAERADPGKTERALRDMVARGEEPTKAKLRREVEPAPSPAAPAADPDADARAALAGLTRAGLEDEVIGLRAENADLRAKLAAMTAERDRLKGEVAAFISAGDHAEVIRRQSGEITRLNRQVWKANEDARIAIAARRKAEDRVKQLEAMDIPL